MIDSRNWTLVGVPPGPINFGDLTTVTATANCIQSDPNWSLYESLPCSSLGIPYNYPESLARALSLIGVSESDTDLLAFLMPAAMSLMIGLLVWIATYRRNPLEMLVVCVATLTPPFFLVIERGNTDGWILVVTLASSYFILRKRPVVAAPLLVLSAAIKVFSIATVLTLFLERPRNRLAISIALVGIVSVGLLLSGQVSSILARTPQNPSQSFGASVAPSLLISLFARDEFSEIPTFPPRIIGLTLFALSLVIGLLFFRLHALRAFRCHLIKYARDTAKDYVSAVLIVSGGTCLVTVYALGMSFDYRLIFFLPVLAGNARVASTFSRFVSLIILLVLALSTPALGPAQLLGDALLIFVVPALAVLIFVLVSGVLRQPGTRP